MKPGSPFCLAITTEAAPNLAAPPSLRHRRADLRRGRGPRWGKESRHPVAGLLAASIPGVVARKRERAPPEENRCGGVPATAPSCCWEPCRRSWGCAGKPLPPKNTTAVTGRLCRSLLPLEVAAGLPPNRFRDRRYSVQPFSLSLGLYIDACVSCSEFAAASLR
ncbi:uncharacterized protein DS421_16g543380 [Arachis hypogaea]|nr:uncharacterized protein DS421_16g543380 [Arachis hypogaea]